MTTLSLRHALALLLSLGAILVLSGCATAWLSQAELAPRYKKEITGTDTLIAMGYPAHAGDYPLPLVLVGEQGTYPLTEGGDEILQLLSHPALDAHHLSLRAMPIHMEMTGEHRFSAEATVVYRAESRSPAEETALTALGFTPDWAGEPHRKLAIAGLIYPPANNLNDIQHRFPRGVPVEFRTRTRNWSGTVDHYYQLTISLPLAVAFDVVTLPVQLMLMAY